MSPADWHAKWIHAPLPRYVDSPPAAYLRRAYGFEKFYVFGLKHRLLGVYGLARF